MTADRPTMLTQLLARLSAGDRQAADVLLPLVYDELRLIAERCFRRQPSGHTLQPTALVHEAYLRLADTHGTDWKDRAHFFAVAALAMRQILVNHALARAAQKRGGDRRRVAIEEGVVAAGGPPGELDILDLNASLEKLKAIDERKHRLVELRFFAGLSVEEVAEVMGLSKSTVEADWRSARAWLNLELSR